MYEQLPKHCCIPSRGETAPAPLVMPNIMQSSGRIDAVGIPGGTAFVGTNIPFIPHDGEAPLKKARIKPFRIGATAVTNAQFHDFIAASGYRTEAERFGWSFVFWAQVPERLGPTDPVPGATWWRKVFGATWRDINGPGTAAEAWHPDHPVVQVSWNDAKAYAKWVGGRLPTEAEWEHAARAGEGDVPFPWGTAEPTDKETLNCNIWQGQFPSSNTCADGHLTTAPAKSFPPNKYGLFNMVGNTWEWTAEPFKLHSQKAESRHRMAQMKGFKLAKGGSFLCHKSYCYRYRIAARTGTSPDSTTTHQGFRIVLPAA